MNNAEINEKVARKLGREVRICPIHHALDCCGRMPNKPYCTDISAATEIISDAKFYVEIKRAAGKQWRVLLGDLTEPIRHDSLAMAICLAFLKLTEGKSE